VGRHPELRSVPLVDPSGPQWIKDFNTQMRRERRSTGIAGFFQRLFAMMFGWLR